MTDLDTQMENTSDLIMSILYFLQLLLCAIMMARLKRRREQRKLRRLFFTLCAVGALLRCLYFGIPDSVFAQGYRPANRKPVDFGSRNFLLNGLQFLIYSVPNLLYFLQYCLIICAYAGMISVLFSQRPTGGSGATTTPVGAGSNGTILVAPATSKASSSGSAEEAEERMIPYKPASRFFQATALTVTVLQVLLLAAIFLFDFFWVVAATCIFVSALAIFSLVAYVTYAVTMVRKLRPVYKYVLNKAQWEAVARQHNYAAVAASPGGATAFGGAPRNSRVLLRSREEHEGFTDRDGLDTSIDRSGRIPNRMRGGAAAQIERERDREAGLDSYPPLHSLPAPILPPASVRGLGSRSSSQGTSPSAVAAGTSAAAMAAATAGRYSPHHSLVPPSSALALLQAQQMQQQGASSSMTNGLVSVSNGATSNATSSSGNASSRSTAVSHSSSTHTAVAGRPSLANAHPSTSDELSYEPEHGEDESESDEEDEEDDEDVSASDGAGSAAEEEQQRRRAAAATASGAGYDEADELSRPRQAIGVGTGSGSDEDEITLHALPRVGGKHMQDSSPIARPQPSPRGSGAVVPIFAPTPIVAGSFTSSAINISGSNQNRMHLAQQSPHSREQQQPKLSYSPVRNNGRDRYANGTIDQQPSTSVDHVISEADFYRQASPMDSTPPKPHPSISYAAAALRGQGSSSTQSSSAGGSGAVSPDYTALDASSTLVPTPRVGPSSAVRGGIGAGLKNKPSGTTPRHSSGQPSPLRNSRSFGGAAPPVLPLLSSSTAADSAEDALAWYAYAQTRKIILLTLCVVLCSGARIASALIELHYTWLQMQTDNMTSSNFPDFWSGGRMHELHCACWVRAEWSDLCLVCLLCAASSVRSPGSSTSTATTSCSSCCHPAL